MSQENTDTDFFTTCHCHHDARRLQIGIGFSADKSSSSLPFIPGESAPERLSKNFLCTGPQLLASCQELGSYFVDPALHPRGSKDTTVAVTFPRSPKFARRGETLLERVSFTAGGKPGILFLILPSCYDIDGADEVVVERASKKKKKWQIAFDWPGFSNPPVTLPRKLYTRASFLHFVTNVIRKQIVHFVTELVEVQGYGYDKLLSSEHSTNMRLLYGKSLRLYGVEQYGKTWVPVLGLDIHMD